MQRNKKLKKYTADCAWKHIPMWTNHLHHRPLTLESLHQKVHQQKNSKKYHMRIGSCLCDIRNCVHSIIYQCWPENFLLYILTCTKSVLSHETRRKEYDIILKQQSFMHIRHNASRAPTHHPSMTPFTRAVYQLPRNLVIGCGIGIFAATFANYFLFRDNHKQEEKLVEAWKNPKTGQWEQPARKFKFCSISFGSQLVHWIFKITFSLGWILS